MNRDILQELGIEQWEIRTSEIAPNVILIVVARLPEGSLRLFLDNILNAFLVSHQRVMIVTSSQFSQMNMSMPHVGLIWFLTESTISTSKPVVRSPSLEELMQDGLAKKRLYFDLACLCNIKA